MLKLGTENISGLYVGEQKIKKAFVGEQLVFEDNPTYTVYFYAVDEEDSSKVLNSSSFTVNPGESVSVNPWDINGYNFAGWYDESGNLVSSGSSFSVTPTGDATYYLKYYEYYTLLVSASGFVSSELVVTINGEDYTITRNADAQGHGAELHLRKNSVVTVKTKTIPSGYKFDKWGLVYANVTSTADPYTFTLTRDLEILHGYLSKASRLPAGYTELEYIEASSSYSNICFKDSLNTNASSTFKLKIYNPSITNSTYSQNVLEGSSSTASAYRLNLRVYQLKWWADFHYGSLSYTELTGFPIQGICEFKVAYANKTISLNDAYSKTLSSMSGFSVSSLGFTVNAVGSGFRFYGMSNSSTGSTSTNYNWEVVPCKNASGEVGYYILGKGKFYSKVTQVYTAGLYGTWTAGPAV